jgi:nucleotide-binding universal stress UspA family protein
MRNTQDQSPRTHDVVVGVDGTAASANAVRYAVREAVRSGGQVDVHHVIAHFTPFAGMFPIPPEDLDDAGRATLAATLEQVGDLVDDVPIRTHLRHGSVVTILVEARGWRRPSSWGATGARSRCAC